MDRPVSWHEPGFMGVDKGLLIELPDGNAKSTQNFKSWFRPQHRARPNQHDVVCIHAREGGEDSGMEARGMAVLLRPDTPTAAEQTAHPVSRNFRCIPYSS